MLETRDFFNEDFYLNSNPDVAEAKAKGLFASGFDHFNQCGKFERRNPSALFDQSLYLAQNLDVAKAIDAGNFASSIDHFLLHGQKEGRLASIVFNNNYYLEQQSDVADAVKKDILTGIEHFAKHGIDEGRASSVVFNVDYYLKHNPDLQAAGLDNQKALQHFLVIGLDEGRIASESFNVNFYLENNSDLKAAGFKPRQAFYHFVTKGLEEGRLGFLPLSYGNDGLVLPDEVIKKPIVTPPEDFQPPVTLPTNDTTLPPVKPPTNDATQSPTTLPTNDTTLTPIKPPTNGTTSTPVTSPVDSITQPPTTLPVDGDILNPTVTPIKTLSGLEEEPTAPLDLPENAGGENSKKNPAPKHLQFNTTQKEYYKNTSVRLKDAWVFDASGASDLDKVEFSLHKIGDSKEDIQTATKFNTYSKDDRWGWFNYSIRDLTPGKYQLKGVAYDKDGGKSNTAVAHFTVSNEELPMPLIGVIDTGFSANNPDIDYSRVTLGKDLVDGDDNPLLEAGEGNEHGTHILGIIAATGNNGVGIYGMNDEAPLWLGRAIGSGKWAESLMEFVDAAKASGNKALVNLSLDMTQVNPDGSVTTRYEFTPKEREALEYARQNGVLIVAAAGNDGDVMSVLGQASQEFDNIITVGAANGNQRADYSSFGYGLDIVTEGGTIANPIVSTVGDDVGTMAGTSVAAAQVTGAASLVWEANPGLNYRQVIEVLKSNATDLNTVGWDKETGAGFLNVDKAVEAAKTIAPVAYAPDAFLTPTTWGLDGQVTPEERAINLTGVTDSSKIAVQINQGVNIRPSADTSIAPVGKLSPGEQVEFDYQTQGELIIDPNGEGSSDVWYHLADGSGFVSGLYITNVQDIPSSPEQPSDPGSGITDPGSGITDPGSGITDPGSGITDPGSGVTDPPISINLNGYTIGGNFYPVFQNYQGTLGNPISDAIQFSGDVSYQLFENGSIVTSQYGTFPLYGGVRQTYLNNGGLNGWLGEPKSAEIDRGNGNVIQYFESGYIYWNGSRATAYREGNGTQYQQQLTNYHNSLNELIRTGPGQGGGYGALGLVQFGGAYHIFSDEDVDGRKPGATTGGAEWDDPDELEKIPEVRDLMEYLGGVAETKRAFDSGAPIGGGYLDWYWGLGGYYHVGFDISFDANTSVRSLVGGKVIQAGGEVGAVAIHNNDLGKTFVYLHMNNISVTKGTTISAATPIGRVSNVSPVQPMGVHLHFEVQEDSELKSLVESNPSLLKQNPSLYDLQSFEHDGKKFYAFPSSIHPNLKDKQEVQKRTDNPLNAFVEAKYKGLLGSAASRHTLIR